MSDNLCDRCLNTCKCGRSIGACRSYNNPARRQFDYRCMICNKKVPKLHKLCMEHNAWLNLLTNVFGYSGMLGLMSKMRDITNKMSSQLKEEDLD